MKRFPPGLIFFLIVSAFIYYVLAAKYCWWPLSGLSLSERGQFGDSFGVFTSLFSALGFGGILLTLWHQQVTIEETNKRAALQQFELILFQLLASFNSIVAEMDLQRPGLKESPVIARGRDCLYRYYMRHLRPNYKRRSGLFPEEDEMSRALGAYQDLWMKHRHNLGHYLRFLYNIYRFIDDSSIDDDSKRKYARIVRAQLSDYELLLIFYNCLHTNGAKRFKPLAEKYALFNNLPMELLLSQEHAKFFARSAFSTAA